MKLSSLRVHGFKSFADVTEVRFHDGITAIVGPNGCGKSNISDAIRWVLGEQRPTAIRGARMEEAIFQGSVHRRPVNRGSVTMVVSNEDGTLPVPFEEVEIGRTVYRDGGSDYTLNRATVRLKDVVDLVRDTGLGANAYNVIENRMIDAILSDRAEERRALFEEASGIGKYKDRRKAATRRLERAETDLQRLEDVIAEVQTKVRSLARQKGRAERWLALRERRLAVEVAVVRHQLVILQERMARVVRELEGGSREGQGMVAEVRTAEADLESLRIRQVDAEKARGRAAAAVEEVRSELVRWERELAVARERGSHAERRLGQIAGERTDARTRAGQLGGEAEALAEDAGAVEAELATVRTDLEASREAADAVRRRLQQAREAVDAVESREREIARRVAQLEGDAEGAEAQAAELERRLDHLQRELAEAAEALSDLAAQGDLFNSRLDRLTAEVSGAREAVDAARHRLEEGRAVLEEARRGELEAADRAASLQARLAALEEMDRAQEGMGPAVKAVLAADLPGVLGPLVDFMEAGPHARTVESWLGPLARGIVVRDREAAEGVRRWFRDGWDGGGGLVLLPLDVAPPPGGRGGLLEAVRPRGQGAPWVRALLADIDVVEEEALLASSDPERVWVTPSGSSRDRTGVIRLGNPGGATGILERKERLRELSTRARAAAEEAEAARSGREEAQARVRQAEDALEAAREELRAAEDARREARSEAAAQVDRRERMDRHRDEMARQVEGTRAARSRARERARVAREDRQALLEEEEELRDRREEARGVLERVQEEWEEARAEESRLTVRATRLEGEANRLGERLRAAEEARSAALERIEALDREEEELGAELEEVRSLQEEGTRLTGELFQRREEAVAELRARDEALVEVGAALQEAERRARVARQAEREASDRRHELELERQELEGRIGRIRDRLEGEWGRPLEALLEEAEPLGEDEETDPDALQAELREIVASLERIGPVNMLAVEEHQEESQRLAFLQEQHDDLVEARNDLRTAIKQINETATGLFIETFERIRENFRSVHTRLFEGGEADIWLEEEDDPLESVIEIHASPRGKRTQRIDLLSGGERALTALALLFAIYLVKPSPFCVLDEVDAPLDENNIGRFIRLLDEFKDQTQFIVITHNPRTIEAADWIYGVTMEEPGVSTIVGVRLEDALETARGTAA